MSILRPSRRDILKLTAAAPAFALTTPVMANTAAPHAGQNTGFFRFSMGAATADGDLGRVFHNLNRWHGGECR